MIYFMVTITILVCLIILYFVVKILLTFKRKYDLLLEVLQSVVVLVESGNSDFKALVEAMAVTIQTSQTNESRKHLDAMYYRLSQNIANIEDKLSDNSSLGISDIYTKLKNHALGL